MADETLGPGKSSVSDETLAADATLQSDDGHHGRERSRESMRRGALIDRYVVLDLAGAGGMGLVLAAYDPQLDRKVAVKLLKFGSEQAQSRLKREAQALAKLDHPNVVGIYDVGTHEGQLFMAMEFVEGTTLAKWMRADEPHTWQEVVRVLGEAGRGLAAAHAVGLVHRDFKPENVMLGREGRVRVMDFGLARTTSLDELELDALPGAATRPALALGPIPLDMTRTGALMGTPAYMAPEQFAGKAADARSDQFGFCVTLYEALYGKRPFHGESLLELITAISDGRMQPTPELAKVPPWLRRIVMRGLSHAPEQRWPSMDALLAALADDPSLRRRRWSLAGAATLLLGLVVAGTLWSMHDDDTCGGLDAPLVGVWDAERRDAVAAAIAATELSYAADTWTRIAPRLDDYARSWHRARIDACQASARGEQSSSLLDQRMLCLDRRLAHLRATVDVLAGADAAAVERALDAVDQLPALDTCADRDALLHDERSSLAPELAATIEGLERRRIAAETIALLGRPSQALELMRPLVAEADALADAPTRARAYLTLARILQSDGNYRDAELALRESYRFALLAGQPREAGAAARALVEVVGGGTGLARPSDGRAWAFHAEILTQAAGTALDQADYLLDIGEVDKMDGNYPAARASFERALASYDALDSDLARRVEAISSLANTISYMGELEPALALYQRARQLVEEERGPTHPQIARLCMSLGDLYAQVGRWAEARSELERAVALFEQALGPRHPTLGFALGVLGYVAGWQGDYAFARTTLERSVSILEGSVGRDHYYYSDAVGKLGAVEYLAGDYAAAGEHYEFARASLERQMGADHPSVGVALGNLAELALTQHDAALALARADAALAILEPKIGHDHFDLLLPLDIRGRALLELGRAREAIPTLERVIAIHERERHDAAGLATLRDALALARTQEAAHAAE